MTTQDSLSERDTPRNADTRPDVSARLPEGGVVELVRRPENRATTLCVFEGGAWRYENSVPAGERRLIPYSADNTLLRNEVVLFPSEPAEYGSEADLVEDVRRFIHAYVDVSARFERLASHYVLLSWIYDAFAALPYLRLLGDPGSGKTRFLLVVGSVCYKPIFASGASTVSPLFRILDAIRGTLVIDEGDFRLSDEKAEIVKILNNGNAPGFPVLRSEVTRRGEVNPTAFSVFGPKLVATRGRFQDPALESRCLTEEMGRGRLREDIPITLPDSYKEEALQLRNKLLLFRFRNLDSARVEPDLVDPLVEPRLNQVFAPFLSVIGDAESRAELQRLIRGYHADLVADRGTAPEAQVLEVIRDLQADPGTTRLQVKEIASWFADRHGDEYDRKVTPRWVGYLIRGKLHLRTEKSHGVYIIPLSERPRLERLFERYGIEEIEGAPKNEFAAGRDHTEPSARA